MHKHQRVRVTDERSIFAMTFDIEGGPPGPENGESRGGQSPASAQQLAHDSYNNDITTSRQVAWWEVHLWRDRTLERLGHAFPMAGTPAWCALGDDDPAKLAAALDAAQHWALRVETCQETQAAAAKAVSTAENWAKIANRHRERADCIAAHRWMKRAVS